MRFRISAETTCRLERGGQSVVVGGEDVAGLVSLLHGGASGKDDERRLLGQLFSLGIVEPETSDMGAAASPWHARLESACLSPWLGIQVAFVSGDTRIPSGEAAVGLFLQPAVVAAASDLSARLRNVLRMLASAALLRGEGMSRVGAQTVVEDVARAWFGSLQPDLPISLKTDTGQLRVHVAEPFSSTSGEPVDAWNAELTFLGSDTHRSVRVPLDQLGPVARVLERASHGEAPDTARLSASVQRVLTNLDGAGGLIERAQMPPVFPSGTARDDLSVTHMGHACLVVDSASTRILIDPMLFRWRRENRQQPLTAGQFGAVDAICFTHYHDDHLELGSLLTLPHDVPVFVPAEEDGPFAPRASKLLGLFGFSDVRVLAPGQIAEVGDLEVEAVPFFGEGRDRLGFAATCFCIARGTTSILAHADASPDSSGASLTRSGALLDLVERRGGVDVVFGSWWQERTFRCQLSPFAPLMPGIPPETWLVDNEQCDCPPEFLEELVVQSRAKLFVTYAESGDELFLPEEKRSAYLAAISHLWRPWDEIARHISTETGVSVEAAEPYMEISVGPGRSPDINRRGLDRAVSE